MATKAATLQDYGTILVERDGPVALLTLNRPDKLNAWTWQLHYELGDAFKQLDEDDSVRAIVVTGAGRAFCAGADLEPAGETFSGRGHPRDEWAERYPETKHATELGTPVIAAINGHAVGAGLTMPTYFDIRYAAEEAKLGFVFNRRGIMPDADLLWHLPRLIGFSRALDLLLTGRIFHAPEAVELGLVNKSLPVNEVLPAAMDLAQDIARNTAPVSVAITKKLAHRFLTESDQQAALELQTRLFAWTGKQPDCAEGVVAFLEKRDPQWKMSKNADLPEDLR